MKDGRFQEIGEPRDIYFRSVNRFVATFVGSPAMNFLLTRITQHNGAEHIILHLNLATPMKSPSN